MSLAEATNLLTQLLKGNDEAKKQDSILSDLNRLIDSQPNVLPGIWPVVLALISDPATKKHQLDWSIKLLQSSFNRSDLTNDLKTNLALPSLHAINKILDANQQANHVKIALQVFATIYPLLFKYSCSGNDQQTWILINELKASSLKIWRNADQKHIGERISAIKVLQKIIQTQSKATNDPRLSRTILEPNLLNVKPNHAFLKPSTLEQESNQVLEELITCLFTSKDSDSIQALITTLSFLVKVRSTFTQLIVTALIHWTPDLLRTEGNSEVRIRSTEKILRSCLINLTKSTSISSYVTQINEFLSLQSTRMEASLISYRQQLIQAQSRKRSLPSPPPTSTSTSHSNESNKKPKLSSSSTMFTLPERGTFTLPIPIEELKEFYTIRPETGLDNPLAQFDASILPSQVCLDFLIASIESLKEETIQKSIDLVRRRLPVLIDPLKLGEGEDEDEELLLLNRVEKQENEREESIDRVDDEQDHYHHHHYLAGVSKQEEEDQGEEEEENVEIGLINFDHQSIENYSNLLPAIRFEEEGVTEFLKKTLRRICISGLEGVGGGTGVWGTIVVRMVTRGLSSSSSRGEISEDSDRRERLREEMFEFVKEDLQGRMEFARLWLNEEWYVGKLEAKTKLKAEGGEGGTEERAYDRWLRKLLEHIMSKSSNKDRAFIQFMIDLPEIPTDEITRLGEMCLRRDQVQLGFLALRELATLRPRARTAALDVLLSLTTHQDKLTRNAAINTVKKWVPDVSALSPTITSFAISLFSRLSQTPIKVEEELKKEGEDDGEDDMAMEVTPPPEEPKPAYAIVKDAVVIDRLDPPETREDVVRHVELLFALCHKDPRLLKPLFQAYVTAQPFAQEHIRMLITPLVKSLGIENEYLLAAIDDTPQGAESLLLRVLNLLGEKMPRLPSVIIQSIKKIAKTRSLDPQFYVMIVSECDKDELKAYIPKIVTLLDGTPERKSLIRSVFLAAIAPPSEKGAMAVRARINLLTPVELIATLHTSEVECGLKPAIEAISICFSMTDAFRPEILSAFMQQILDQSPTSTALPTLFLRTAIQAVTTYKSALTSFIASTVLTKLINKKVWESPPIWEGFVRLAKIVQPASFKSLLMLPKAQLEDVVRRQPALKEGLRNTATSGLGAAPEILEVLGDGAEAT